MSAARDTRRGSYDQPYRPAPVAWVNAAGKALGRLGVRPARLDAGNLMDAARRKTGLVDYGEPWFVPALEQLVDAIEREARLNTVGQLITQTRLVGALATRLRVQELLRRTPAIAEAELSPPLVIAGLQRTGTTMLHRLLASDPTLRALASWEAIAPVAPTPARRGRSDPRLRQAKLSEKGLAYMAPDFFAIHPVEAEAPEEDVLLLDFAFHSTTAEATMHVPSYSAWLEQQDHTRAYQYVRTLLQVLQHQRGGQRWLLKTPHHLEYLDVLRKVFPGVQVLHTHRDPTRTLASFCSMVAHGRGVFSDQVSAEQVGAHWSRKVGRMLDCALAVREEAGDEGFVDVSYYDLIQDPIAQVQRAYDALGVPFSDTTRAAMLATRRNNPQHKYGKHHYGLEDFGLRAEGVEPLFARYRSRFGIRRE